MNDSMVKNEQDAASEHDIEEDTQSGIQDTQLRFSPSQSSSSYFDEDDEDDEYEFISQADQFRPKITVTFDDLLQFCNNDVKLAKRAFRIGKNAIEAGASMPFDVSPRTVLNKGPEVGASMRVDKDDKQR